MNKKVLERSLKILSVLSLGCMLFFTPISAAGSDVFVLGGGGGGGGGGGWWGYTDTGGGGGGGGAGAYVGGTDPSGAGGDGGVYPGFPTMSYFVVLLGGAGGANGGIGANGAGGAGGVGGAGGTGTTSTPGATVADGQIGGTGDGFNDNGGYGGAGGDASYVAGSLTHDAVAVVGGTGGNSGNTNQGGKAMGDGGNGGNAALVAVDLTAGSVAVRSGAGGIVHPCGGNNPDYDGIPGTGGDAALTVSGTLNTPNITITKQTNGGAVDVDIDTLDAKTDTTITVTGTAATDVVLSTINVEAGTTLTIDNSNGDLTIGSIHIAPGGNVVISNPIPGMNVSPTFSGDTTLTLTQGYTATSTGAYTFTGNPAPTVTKTSGDPAITWDDTNKKLDIAAGLGVGIYPVMLTASNGVPPDATLTFTLTVSAVPLTPTITGITASPTSHTATGGSSTVTITGNDLAASTLTVQAFDAANQPAAGLVATRTGAGGVTLTFPWNSFTTQDEVYTIRVSLDGGVTWATPAAQVIVQREALQTRAVTHPGTGVSVTGPMYQATGLNLSTNNVLHAAGCPTCDIIRRLQGQDYVLALYDVALNPHIGASRSYNVTLPVPASYNGKTLSVIHCNGGVMEITNGTVSGNAIQASVDSFSPFSVLKDTYGNATAGDVPKTGDTFPWEVLTVLLVALTIGSFWLLHKGQRTNHRQA